MPERVVYVRLPGLLAHAASQRSRLGGDTVPLVVVEAGQVRSASPDATRRGIHAGQSVRLARRLCPLLSVVPLEEVDARPFSRELWDALADLSPTVEPATADSVYADLVGGPPTDLSAIASRWPDAVIGSGPSRVAARALAECGLSPGRLAEADSRWLWPEDSAVTARLYRLGLTSFGQVAALGESALHYQFGKTGRLLYRRAVGEDLDPVRALWPLPTVEAARDYALEPITDSETLRLALTRLAATISRKLSRMSRYARRLRLCVQTERGEDSREWILPAPIQQEREILSSLRRLRQQVTIAAPVTRLSAVALDIDLPTSVAGNLFDSRAAERKLAIAATRQKLHARYGVKSLFPLSALPVSRSEQRRELWKASRAA